jgi:hypothetical protein
MQGPLVQSNKTGKCFRKLRELSIAIVVFFFLLSSLASGETIAAGETLPLQRAGEIGL